MSQVTKANSNILKDSKAKKLNLEDITRDFAETITNETIANKRYESFMVEGQICKIEEKSFKEGSTFFLITITNYEDAFTIRVFEDSPKNDGKFRQRTDLPLAYLKTFKVGN
ncbi:hypothetical protein FACS1894218_0480 [Bacilli bacterium]|nr:hypothetical protein FACS1894218_0480 [Bacilli bacterium]